MNFATLKISTSCILPYNNLNKYYVFKLTGNFKKDIIKRGMKMIEYEYSFEVKDLQPFIDYCEKNGYKLKEDYCQTRIIYRHKNKTIGRLTISEANGKILKKLDFKDDKLTGDDLIERRETKALEYEDDRVIESILEFLNYKQDNTLKRTRKTYEKGGVKLELDHYFQPRTSFVVAIEGEKEEVDKVYNLVKDWQRID